jgi:3-phytase
MKFHSYVSTAITIVMAVFLFSCAKKEAPKTPFTSLVFKPIKPVFVTDTTDHDTDDPAIWINKKDKLKSLVIGTDKDEDGGLYAYDLRGKIVNKIPHLQRPNNVDILYGVKLGDTLVDIAFVSERFTHNIRIFRLPDFYPLDNGGIPAFEGETGEEFRDLMGIAGYDKNSNEKYIIAGRKTGPTDGTYLWQYRIADGDSGYFKLELARKFGKFSGLKEIEAIAVDHEYGFVYYSDENFGIRKYYADPSKGNEELTTLGTTNFVEDHEGISIFNKGKNNDFILISDQQRNCFRAFPRGLMEGTQQHPELFFIPASTNESDGSEITTETFDGLFRGGLFVAMSDNKTFHYYHVGDIINTMTVQATIKQMQYSSDEAKP